MTAGIVPTCETPFNAAGTTMSTATLPPWNIDEPPPLPVRRFTVAEYERLAEIGVLTPDDRVELLEGWIVPKMSIDPPHAVAIELIDDLIVPLLPAGWRRRIQLPVRTFDSEPEPDVAVVRGTPRQHSGRHPDPKEVGLIIEVADSSLGRDRGTKARLYARAGIPVYWIVNLIDRQIEVHADPTGPADEPEYRRVETVPADADVEFSLDGNAIARLKVAEMLP